MQKKMRSKAEEPESDITELPAPPVVTDVEDLIDEIDAVLEENAEQFVKGYVQKGGQ